LNALAFYGGQYLISNDSAFSRLLLPTSTVFVVQNASNVQQNISTIWTTSGGNLRYNLHLPHVNTDYFDFGDDMANRVGVSTSIANPVGTHLWTMDATEGGTLTWNYDGTTIASETPPTTGVTFNCPIAVGAIAVINCAVNPSGYYLNGQIGEILVYNRALTQPEYQYIEGYLAWKWGIATNLPAGHPWKSNAPSGAHGLTLTVSPAGTAAPGSTLAYTTTFVNAAGSIDYNPVVTSPIPANCDFAVGSEAHNIGTTAVTVAVAYSYDGANYTTTPPTSGAGGAPPGYDRTVKDIRWTLSGGLAPGSPNNTGTLSFSVRIQ
jgi:hypothetical protein